MESTLLIVGCELVGSCHDGRIGLVKCVVQRNVVHCDIVVAVNSTTNCPIHHRLWSLTLLLRLVRIRHDILLLVLTTWRVLGTLLLGCDISEETTTELKKQHEGF